MDTERLQVRIWRSDAQEPVLYPCNGSLLLGRDLLGKHATSNADEAPILRLTGSSIRVDVRKRRRHVWGVHGRLFDDLPAHPGSLGRYWTWVTHPEKDESLVFMRKRPPHQASYLEGHARLYRMRMRPVGGDIETPLRMQPRCVIVAGLGAVEISGAPGSTELGRPEPSARLDLDELRRRLQSMRGSASELMLPCVVPGAPRWLKDEAEAIAHLTSMLRGAFRSTDPPDGLLLPCYLPDSTPGLILARHSSDDWVFTSSDAALEGWIQRGCEPPPGARPAIPPPRPAGALVPFEHGEYSVHFENEAMIRAARDLILKGSDYKPAVARAATQGAWRRAACVYALRLRACEGRDLRQYGWSNGMARCVEELAAELGSDPRGWLGKEDGPRAFVEKFTVKRGGAPAEDAAEALAALLDGLVRPHGRTRIETGQGRLSGPPEPPATT